MFGSSWLRGMAALSALLLAGAFLLQAGAEDPANPFFRTVWERTDQPVADGLVGRTWQWGPEANTLALREPYAESPGGQREVQYYDKSRMEITQPTSGDPTSIWYVTNGLLVVELMSGRLQLGDNTFAQHPAASVNVAGDTDDTEGPSYAALAGLRAAAPLAAGAVITQTVDRAGAVGQDAQYSSFNVTAAYRVTAPGIDHQVASPFWTFMNATGPVYENGAVSEALLFQNPYFATGLPVTEAYWVRIKVAGSIKPVLVQCFERRCLTYTPDNAAGWQVEQGNVGQHYYQWRYVDIVPGGGGTATATATEPSPEPSPSASEPPETDYNYSGSFGSPSDPARNMSRPVDVAFDADGNFYVVDSIANRIQKYDRNGLFISQWGETGSGNGQFNFPSAAVVDASGYVYVADYGNHRIQKFDQSGQFLLKWGSEGTLDGQFKLPSGLAVDTIGNVYVSDTGNNRVQKFNSMGVWLSKLGASGTADGQLTFPQGIVVDAEGRVYVCDRGNNRVQVFDVNGAFLRKWGTAGTANGQFDALFGIALSPDEVRVYVSDLENARIQVFDTAGAFLAVIGTAGTGAGQLDFPLGLALSDSETLYVAEGENARIQIFDIPGASSVGFLKGDSRGHFGNPLGIEVTEAGAIVVVDSALNQLKLFGGTDGEYYGEWGDLELSAPSDVAIDGARNYYVTDSGHNRVVKYNALSRQTGAWGVAGSGDGQFNNPRGIAIDDEGNVYVVDQGNHRVQKFTSAGAFISSWGSKGSATSQFNAPNGIADWGGSVFVTDLENHRVQEFDLNGGFIRQWGGIGTDAGQFIAPYAITVDALGFLYVADSINNRIQKFTSGGEFVEMFGTPGSGDGQLDNPHGVAVDANGNVLISDQGNGRVVIYSTPQ